MERAKALTVVKKVLPQARYEHTLGVVESSLELAEAYGVDMAKAEMAAIFHDYAKYRDRDEMQRIIREEPILPDLLLQYHHELWHAPVGALLVEREWGVTDREVLLAIASHTTGRPNMMPLEQVVFVADAIEPGRTYPGVEQLREKAKQSLEEACIAVSQHTIRFLLDRQVMIYPLTLETYNAFVQRKG
ncbi:bis(5'-nucleosyl)-tetraphosphatase (symmetrical) YqeK [Bacillus fonticola]|uniref:bis(5'-nucleosyl)-tetraphosphatase (symmetrical) YqeK n=1 Tax=Bacillus fonticola TaxID=2728853 RepID=UPI001473D752|nr:bis(5'-nucleosyl)-tetraphosphatase (symmetrical) YqeK [Bacillus fonticola]